MPALSLMQHPLLNTTVCLHGTANCGDRTSLSVLGHMHEDGRLSGLTQATLHTVQLHTIWITSTRGLRKTPPYSLTALHRHEDGPQFGPNSPLTKIGHIFL